MVFIFIDLTFLNHFYPIEIPKLKYYYNKKLYITSTK